MYIRRKVFSNIQVNESEVKTFSTTEYELDENLEARIFSGNEEVEVQKEKDNVKTAAKAAIGTGIGLHAAGTVADSYLAKKSENALRRRGIRIANRSGINEAESYKEIFAAGKKYRKDLINNNKVFERALRAKNGKAYKLYKGGRAAQNVGTGLVAAGIAGIAGKAIYDKVKKDKEKKEKKD